MVEVSRVEKSEPFNGLERPKYIPKITQISMDHPDNISPHCLASSPKQNTLTGANKKPFIFKEGEQLKKGHTPITHLHAHIHHIHHELHHMHYLPTKIGKFIKKQSYQSSAYICIASYNSRSYMHS